MKFIKIKEVMSITSLKRSTIYNYMNEGKFPQTASLGARSVAWVESEVQEWISDRIDFRDAKLVNRGGEEVGSVTESDVIAFIKDKFKQLSVGDAVTWLMRIVK